METGTTESTVAKLHIFSIFKYMPKAGRALYEMHGRDASRICKMSCAELAGHGLTDSVIKKIKDPRLMDMQYENLKWYESEGISIIDYNSCHYPPLLKETGDLPPLLFVSGELDFIGKKIISVVGTRQPDKYGEAACRSIIKRIAMEMPDSIIVSGLAKGIDYIAHRSAIEFGLRTAGISAAGADITYPAENRELYESVIKHGSVMTEFEKGTRPQKFHFLQRNRIIAGIGQATIVIESKIRGGAMNTARLAFSYDREVFAVPGRVGDENSAGCNMLISQNIARILSSIEYFLHTMNWHTENKKKEEAPCKNIFPEYDEYKTRILLSLEDFSSADMNTLREKTGIEQTKLFECLAEMEEAGIIRTDFKNDYCLSEIPDKF